MPRRGPFLQIFGAETPDIITLLRRHKRAAPKTYFNGFLTASFYEDPDALSLFYGTQPPLVPPGLEGAFPGIKVFGSSSERVDLLSGYRGYVIDGFENGDAAFSDSGLLVQVSRPGIIEEADLRTGGLTTTHLTKAAFVRWQSDDQITWNLDLATRTELAGATSLVFRIGALDFVATAIPCTAQGASAPHLTLILAGDGQSAEVDLASFGRLETTDTRLEVTCDGLQSDGCWAQAVMQTTFRIPLQELCSQLPGGLFLSQIEQISLRFEGDEGIVILDDLEIRSIPGEQDVECHCPP